MSHTYSVTSATRNATTTDPDPLVVITAAVDSGKSRQSLVFYAAIMQANAAGGVSAVQSLFAPVLLGAVEGAPYQPVPLFPSVATAPATFIANQRVVDVPEALVGTWAA
jgi:hypothetical protein